jgi:hypothetical protein
MPPSSSRGSVTCSARWGAVLGQQLLPPTADDRRDEQHVLVDEALVDQRLDERRAAPHEHVLPLAQRADPFDDVVGDDRRVVPVGVLQRRRHDVLGHRVERVGEEVARARGPGGGEALVGDPPEQHRVGLLQHLAVELAGLVAEERAGPQVRVLGDVVERGEGGDGELAHVNLRVA